MRARLGLTLVALALVAASACGGRLGRQYEYEEDVTLGLDGSATVVVNASIPALVALRGLDLDPRPNARLDRLKVRELYQSSVGRVTRVSRPWRRHGRRFVQVRVEVDDIRRLSEAPPFAWSTYEIAREGEQVIYRQTIGPSADEPVEDVGWTTRELVAFRLHLPSRVQYHNVRDLDTGGPGEVERGNILAWEQWLTDRLAGKPLELEVRMEDQSILYTTVAVFGLSFASAVVVLVAFIWVAVRRGRKGS